jgi:hypothetical protein
MRKTFALLSIVLILGCADRAKAQFFGSASLGFNSSSNVESVDTTEAADKLILPSLFLGYDFHPSTFARINVNASYSPSIYTEESSRSYTTSSIGAHGYFYLTNHEAIRKEAEQEAIASSIPEIQSGGVTDAIEEALEEGETSEVELKQTAANDAHVQSAISALYHLSSSLDSTEFASGKSVNRKQAQSLNETKDSISEVAITIADLLDAAEVSDAVRDVTVQELRGIENSIAKIASLQKHGGQWREFIRIAIAELTKLSFAVTPSPTRKGKSANRIDNPFGSILNETTVQADITQKVTSGMLAEVIVPSVQKPSSFLLLSSSSRFRFFDAADVSVLEDQYAPNATTFATQLNIPLYFESRRNQPENIDRNYTSTTFGAALETYFGEAASLRFSFDHINSTYPNDTAYTNNENRLRLGSRIALGGTTALLAEGILGFRRYLKPLQFESDAKVTRKLRGQSTTVASDFTQLTFGAGLAQWFGDRFVLGVLGSLSRNPNLRPYLAERPDGELTSSVGISDDEYTYDLDRYVAFATARLPLDLDAGVDVSLEHRLYGSVTTRRGTSAIFSNEAVGAGRTEDGTSVRGSISRYFLWDERLFGVFTGFVPEFSVSYTDVSSSISRYSYTDLSTLLQLTLNF